jgi:hypothetical protein
MSAGSVASSIATPPYRWIDSDSPEGEGLLEEVPEDARALQPIVLLPDGSALTQPTTVGLARRLEESRAFRVPPGAAGGGGGWCCANLEAPFQAAIALAA